MTSNQIERITSELNIIRKRLDRLDEKMDKAEVTGDMERYARLDKQQDKVLERLEGMNTVLKIIGYRVWQGKSDEPWKVVAI